MIAADSIPVETIRRAKEDSGVSSNELARRLGWFRVKPDITKVRRSLGLHPSGGSGMKQSYVTYERALELIEAMGLDPVDYGL